MKLEQENFKLLEEIQMLRNELSKEKEEAIIRERRITSISDEIKIKDEIVKKTINVAIG